ncbi:MAG: sugar kinase, partial [Actinobacteria bacterium]|nr:sugar kinase [Actinomycetota bacterium]NIW30231.1 sugar kinase [Actinomycetota bacterium]
EVDDLARRLLTGADQQLVLRRGAGPASVVTAAGVVSEPALPVDVIDPTGAGDAFVAGFLFASNAGWPPASRLQLGHFMASRVLGVIDDLVPPFEP